MSKELEQEFTRVLALVTKDVSNAVVQNTVLPSVQKLNESIKEIENISPKLVEDIKEARREFESDLTFVVTVATQKATESVMKDTAIVSMQELNKNIKEVKELSPQVVSEMKKAKKELEKDFQKVVSETTQKVTESVVRDSALLSVKELNQQVKELKEVSSQVVVDVKKAKDIYLNVEKSTKESLEKFNEHIDSWLVQQEKLVDEFKKKNKKINKDLQESQEYNKELTEKLVAEFYQFKENVNKCINDQLAEDLIKRANEDEVRKEILQNGIDLILEYQLTMQEEVLKKQSKFEQQELEQLNMLKKDILQEIYAEADLLRNQKQVMDMQMMILKKLSIANLIIVVIILLAYAFGG